MKKIFALLLLLSIVLCFASCTPGNSTAEANKLIPLPKGATLHIGTNSAIVNTHEEVEKDMYLTITSHVVYSLNRVYISNPDYVPENCFPASEGSNYYYYWTVNTIEEDVLLGKQKTIIDTTHEYLPYSEGEAIAVKTKTVTSHSYDYQGGFVEKGIEYTVDLNGYFTTLASLRAENPELGAFVNTANKTDRYFVDTNTPTTTQTSTQNYTNTFCYITYDDSSSGTTEASGFIPLQQNETLYIGSQGAVVNAEQETKEDMYLTFVSHITYSLNRVYLYNTSYIPENYFPAYEGSNYYYYWSTDTVTDEVLLGKRTTKSLTTYEYLPYAEGEAIAIKSTTTTSYSYDYQGGFVEKGIEYTVDLNGYFTSLSSLRASNEALGDFINTQNATNKYYVDTTTPKTTQTYTQNFTNTYYEITNNSSASTAN